MGYYKLGSSNSGMYSKWFQKGDDESEDIEEDNLGELEALPNDLVNAFDDFHFISDDDFDGFNENE